MTAQCIVVQSVHVHDVYVARIPREVSPNPEDLVRYAGALARVWRFPPGSTIRVGTSPERSPEVVRTSRDVTWLEGVYSV